MPRETHHDLAPGETQKIEGQVVLFDWERHREGSARCEIVQRDDGAAYVEFARYTELTRGFTDARRVPIEGETFLALVNALFAPVTSGEPVLAARRAAVASGRYARCSKCNRAGDRDDGWNGCPVCHGKGVAPVDRIATHEAERGAAIASRASAVAHARWAAERPLALDGSVVFDVTDDDGRGATMASAVTVAVGKTVRVQVGRTLPIRTASADVRDHYREVAGRLRRDHVRQLRDQRVSDSAAVTLAEVD